MRTAKALIRLGGCSGWSECSLGIHVILLVYQLADPCSLIRVFAVHMDKIWVLGWYQKTPHSEGSLISDCVVVQADPSPCWLHFIDFVMLWLIWATSWENVIVAYANNKGADQSAHPRNLISAFVVLCLDSRIPLLPISKISRPWVASVALETGLSWSQNPKTGFRRGSHVTCK